MFLQNSQRKIEEEFLKLTEKLGADREPLKTICEKLDGCGRELGLAMKYLYVTAPYSDLVNYSFEEIQDFASHGLFLYNTLERVKELPEEMFLNYILDHRVNEEEVLPCRSFFWNELKDRIEGKNAKDAAIEVNYWCAEEATYHSGDDRTLPALTVYRRGYGRCGEESVFLVNALRSVGIPARQVYVPRWSHCDDNHAWVELWCDGKWYFTGACEPLMILNKGWFTNASSRAMMVHSRLFDLFPAEGEDVIGKEGAAVMLNQTTRYARVKTVSVKVTDKEGAAVKGAQVQFLVLNMGEYFPIAKAETDEKGTVSLVTGLGSVRVLAFLPGMEGFAQADLDTRAQDEISLNLTGRSWKGDTLELALIPGIYRIITTNRLPNGNQFAWEKTFTIKEGGQREETLRLREAQLGDMLERISLPEFEVKDSAGNTVTCAELTKGGKKILMWLEESREPTEHILNEMLEHAEKFHEFENSISFMIRTPEAKQDPLLAKVLKMFPNVSIYYDSFEENIELLGRRMYVDPDKLPLILVTNGESVGIYATSGYNVGTGDMLIRIMEEVPEV